MGGMKLRRANVGLCLIMMLVHQYAGRTAEERLYVRTNSIDPPCKYKTVLGNQNIGSVDTYPASPQLTASQRMLIHSSSIIAKGTLDAALIAVDTIPRVPDAVANVAKGLSKTFLKTVGYLGPALGIFSTAVGAAMDVNSPTADDILKEVNKAVTMLSEEVDTRFLEMKDYVDDNILRLERDLNENKFTFLACYWAECVKSITWKDSEQCQFQAHRLIQASLHEFLKYLPKLKNKNGTVLEQFDLNRLTLSDLRRMEASQLNFMNYAFMSMYVTRTLQTTYGFLVQEKKEKSQSSGGEEDLSAVVDKTCRKFLEERAERLKKQTIAEQAAAEFSEEEIWQGYYCTFRRDFEENAKLFKMYGDAVIKATGEPNRLVPKSPFDINRISYVGDAWHDPKTVPYHVSDTVGDTTVDCNIDTVSCSMPFAGRSLKEESPCKVRVDVLTNPTADDDMFTKRPAPNPARKKKVEEVCILSNMVPHKIKHEKPTYFDGEYFDAVKEYCTIRLEDQNNQYNKRRSDVRNYWKAHVGVLTECYNRLAASSREDLKMIDLKKCDQKKILEDLTKK